MSQLQPFYKQVQAHYDLSNDFFRLFLDPSMTYSCAYFEREDMSLAEAQLAKIDLSLGKCDLPAAGSDGPRATLLDIGCGWGALARRAVQRYHVNVIGLTLSKEQYAHNTAQTYEHVSFRLQGWEEFDEPVDRIVSIGAFEHFRKERYAAFFEKCHALLPTGGRMMLHTIVLTDADTLRQRGIAVGHEEVLFAKFIRRYIFPGGQLCTPQTVIDHAQRTGFIVSHVQSLQLHYARTLDCWADALRARRDQAITIAGQDTYDLYMHYLTGCAHYFRTGHNDVMQFTLLKQ